MMMGNGWGMGAGGWIFLGVFWLAVIGLIVRAVGGLPPGPGRGGQARQPTALEILDRRFALGELDVEQYRRAREVLVGHPAEPH